MERGNLYDILIIGGGPAGLTAGLYAGRANLKVGIVERGMPGGQAANTEIIENYPGVERAEGPSLAMVMQKQAESFGAEFLTGDVETVRRDGKFLSVHTSGGTWITRALIVATGAEPRKLGVPGETEWRGRGVSYCATCDGAFFRGKELVVVGGGDSAVEEGLYLTRHAAKVTIVHRRDQLRAQKILQERAFKNEKISFIWNATVSSIEGDGKVQKVVLKDTKSGEMREFPADGVFIYVGMQPNTAFLKGSDLAEILDQDGYIVTNEKMQTRIPGVYAAGDVRNTVLRQVVTATADGAVAAFYAGQYVEETAR